MEAIVETGEDGTPELRELYFTPLHQRGSDVLDPADISVHNTVEGRGKSWRHWATLQRYVDAHPGTSIAPAVKRFRIAANSTEVFAFAGTDFTILKGNAAMRQTAADGFALACPAADEDSLAAAPGGPCSSRRRHRRHGRGGQVWSTAKSRGLARGAAPDHGDGDGDGVDDDDVAAEAARAKPIHAAADAAGHGCTAAVAAADNCLGVPANAAHAMKMPELWNFYMAQYLCAYFPPEGGAPPAQKQAAPPLGSGQGRQQLCELDAECLRGSGAEDCNVCRLHGSSTAKNVDGAATATCRIAIRVRPPADKDLPGDGSYRIRHATTGAPGTPMTIIEDMEGLERHRGVVILIGVGLGTAVVTAVLFGISHWRERKFAIANNEAFRRLSADS
jgi:hypothetical protein